MSSLFASPIAYSEVWNKRKGGGAEDVFITGVQDVTPFVTTSTDFPEPDSVQNISGFIAYTIELDGSKGRLVGIEPEITEAIAVSDDQGESTSLQYFDSLEHSHGYNLEGLSGTYVVTVPTTQVIDGVSIVILYDSQVYLKTTIGDTDVLNGVNVSIEANLFNYSGSALEADVNDWANTSPIIPTDVKHVRAEIKSPSGKVAKLNLKDKGNSGDKQRGDGIYAANYKPTEGGKHEVKINWNTKSNSGALVRRSDVTNLYVSSDVALITSSQVHATEEVILGEQLEPDRYGLPLVVKNSKGEMPEYLNVRAEIWSDNKSKPVGWIGGSMKPVHKNGKNWTIPLSFHSGWLTEDTFSPPYHIRNILLVNEENGINILRVQKDVPVLNLPDFSMLKKTGVKSEALQNAMTGGVAPSQVNSNMSDGDIYRRIANVNEWRIRNPVIFLHGFCSQGNETYGTGSTGVRDNLRGRIMGGPDWLYNQRTKGTSAQVYAREVATEITRRINNGQIDGIRGIVAHSQGGMAGATLMDDYGGLFSTHPDYDSSIRMVSMGTPYKGSSLMNNSLSRIVNIYTEIANAAGLTNKCGTDIPYDLDPPRNYRWRNTISSQTRNEILAWRTSHRKSYWYRPKVCSEITSLMINHHDDGIIAENDGEQFAGQDRHAYRWCHVDRILGIKTKYPYQLGMPDFGNDVARIFNNIGTTGTVYCSSGRVDPNNDGWGWENGQSCQVFTGFVDTNWCNSSQSDPDGDGWGWENSQSCQVR